MRYRTEKSDFLYTCTVHLYITCQRQRPKSQLMLKNVACHVQKLSQLQSGTLDPGQKTSSLLSSYIEAQSV